MSAIFYISFAIALLIGIILYFFLHKKVIEKKILQVIAATIVFCTFYFNISFYIINIYVLKIFYSQSLTYFLYIQILPLLSLLSFNVLYWLKHFVCKEEKIAEKQKSKDSRMVFIAFAASSALINLFLPPINELWLKLVIMLGFGALAGFIVGFFLWRNRKRKGRNK